jgi:prolycopene isomerase
MYFSVVCFHSWQGLSRNEYEGKKEVVANEIIRRLEKKLFPGLQDSIVLKEVSSCLPCCNSIDISSTFDFDKF